MKSTDALPKGWNKIPIKRLVDNSRYYQIGDGDHGSIKPEMYQDNGIPYIRVQNLSWDGKITIKDIVRIPEEIHLKNKKSRLLIDDILIAKTGATIGKVGIVTPEVGESNTTSSVGKITVDQSKYFPKYILYCLISRHFQNQLWLDASMKSAQPGFNIDQLVDYVIFIPELEKQKQIAYFLDKETVKIDELIEKQEHMIKLLKERRESLITNTVTGMLRI